MTMLLSTAPMLVAGLTVMLAMAAPPPVLAKDQAGNKRLVEAAMQAWGAGTGSPYDLLADDASWTIVGHSAASKTYPSREDFLREVISPFNARMSVGLKPKIREIVSDGDYVVVFFDASGIAKDGVPYSNTYSWWLDFVA
jgi:ketosteroid isomerase-like protein